MAADPELLLLVDKKSGLMDDFIPHGLAGLDGTGLSLSKKGLSLRKPVLEALLSMDKSARSEGISLVVSSTYRSYAYQTEVFARNVAQMGESEASRVSARAGHSQHQLGTAIDFGSIDNSFANTKAGLWLETNAARFGFSQSYPRGMEPVTGYLWESWHYRYIGLDAVALQKEYFGGIQQYLMEFLAGR
jgi:D-alanyl-D-alanine carboxypeptidase